MPHRTGMMFVSCRDRGLRGIEREPTVGGLVDAVDAASVDLVMVVPADEREVVEVRLAAVFPGLEVMDLRKARSGGAVLEAASSIPGDHRFGQVGWGCSGGAPEVEDLGAARGDDAVDLGVFGEAA